VVARHDLDGFLEEPQMDSPAHTDRDFLPTQVDRIPDLRQQTRLVLPLLGGDDYAERPVQWRDQYEIVQPG
jgi:hypothetical protein